MVFVLAPCDRGHSILYTYPHNYPIRTSCPGPPKERRTARRGTDIALKNKVDYDGVEYEEEDLGLP